MQRSNLLLSSIIFPSILKVIAFNTNKPSIIGFHNLIHIKSSNNNFYKSFITRSMSTISPSLSLSQGEELPDLVHNLNSVKSKMGASAITSNRNMSELTLIAVSKTKPPEAIQTLYDFGHRDFGENYFQELLEKAEKLPRDISWHFIGHLQSGKASKLIREVPNLVVVETVDTLKLASKLNAACITANRPNLDIYLQVHTSDEETKSGVTPDELNELVDAIVKDCPNLTIKGLMTIGAPGDLSCFDKLVSCRATVAGLLNVPVESLHLSMGMSGDFEEAIAKGATHIRVGSTIFGARIYPK